MGMTVYGLQIFNRRGKKLLPEQPETDRDKDKLLRKAERLAKEKTGVVVYQVECDDWLGDVDDPVVIARHGELPPQFADPAF